MGCRNQFIIIMELTNRGCFPPTDSSPLCRGGLRGLQHGP